MLSDLSFLKIFLSLTILSILSISIILMTTGIMMIDSNAIIGMLTLIVTCIPGIWFLLRCRESRQSLRYEFAQDPETGFSHAVRDVLLNPRFTLSSPPVLLGFPFLMLLLLSPFLLNTDVPSDLKSMI